MRRPSPAAVLALALAGISFAGPLVRLSHAHPIAIAIWRLGFALVVIAVALAVTGSWRQWRTLAARDAVIGGGAGVLLALHFWSWNASVGLTSVAASVVLVNTQPIFVGLLSVTWLREPPTTRQWIGMLVAIAGGVVIALPDLRAPGSNPLLGDALALIGAVAAAFYYVTGRRLRARVGLWPYVGLVYGVALIVLLLLAVVVSAPVAPQPPRELAIFAALAIGPMLLGHTGLNWALKYLPAYVVNVTLLGEPIGAALLAAAVPSIRETPNAATIIGGLLVLTGVLATSQPIANSQ